VDGKGDDWSKDFTGGYWNATLFNIQTGRAYAALYELRDFAGAGTGIHGITTATKPSADIWYSLDGRRLNSKPAIKGLYINNGRKVIVR
jgi:arabinogalactan endo-1,4-beta-galactosidase